MLAIDIHTHVVPNDFPAYPRVSGGSSWPSMAECSQCNHRTMMIDGKVFRGVSRDCCSTATGRHTSRRPKCEQGQTTWRRRDRDAGAMQSDRYLSGLPSRVVDAAQNQSA
jgi:hypothetical protein